MAKDRVGIWLIGAKGGVATTTVVGMAALKKGLIGTTGLVSELPRFRHLPLLDWADLGVGRHEIQPGSLADEARRRGQTGTLGFLAGFFKTPLGAKERRFDRQFAMLEDWAAETLDK